ESVDHAQRDSPGDDTLVQVHGIQRAPGWLLARPAIRIPEARVFAPGAGAPVGDGRRGTEGLEPAHRSDLVEVDAEAPANRVEGRPRPVRSPERARERERQPRAGRREERPRDRGVEQLAALAGRVRSDLGELL